MKLLNIGKEFSPDPYGRYRTDGDSSGEAFREDVLLPAIKALDKNEKLIIVIDDGVEAYGSSFLTEGFAGIVKYGYMASKDLLEKLEISYTNPEFEFFKNKIVSYIKEAKYNSETYKPSK